MPAPRRSSTTSTRWTPSHVSPSAKPSGWARRMRCTFTKTHRVRKYIGAYAAVLGGADAVVFTGGIGENSALVRSRVCDGLLYMGIALDETANTTLRAAEHGGIVEVSAPRSPTKVIVVRTDEERMI